MVTRSPYLTVVVPAYNEESCIEDSLARLVRFAREKSWDTEILVVDDGSTDRTALLVERFPAIPPVSVSLLRQPSNRGKGAAVQQGMAAARGRLVSYMDADLSYDLVAVELAHDLISTGTADVVIGDRTHPQSRNVRPYPWWRRISGQAFSMLIQIVLFREVFDTQCGFKCCSSASAKELFPLLSIPGFGFDAELLYLAVKRRKRIHKIPVILNHSHDSKVRLVRDSLVMFFDLFTIKRNYRLGRYESKG